MKTFIANRAKAFESGNDHLPRPRGVILVGIPGTGNHLSCKATANILGLASNTIGHWSIKRIAGWRIRTKNALRSEGH